MNQTTERMISNRSPAKTANTIKGIRVQGFFVRGPLRFAHHPAINPAFGPQTAKNKGVASFYQRRAEYRGIPISKLGYCTCRASSASRPPARVEIRRRIQRV